MYSYGRNSTRNANSVGMLFLSVVILEKKIHRLVKTVQEKSEAQKKNCFFPAKYRASRSTNNSSGNVRINWECNRKKKQI